MATPVSREVVEDVPLMAEIMESITLSEGVMEGVPFNTDEETVKRREQCRLEEWKVDVPTIGAVYSNLDNYSLCEGGPIVIFMSGLGRPFRDEGWDSERHWLRRAWTLQETPILSKCRIAGLPDMCYYGEDEQKNLVSLSPASRFLSFVLEKHWPWNCKV